jgi:alpha-tubulin suppressor-like RCC1 family protein
LEPCTTYHYQAEAENEANEGTPSMGGDQTFTTGGCDAISIATGSQRTCAVLSSGEVDCWGGDEFGALGNGTDGMPSLTPDRVSGITTATSVSSNVFNSCVVLSGGGVDCWGENKYGQLGDGSESSSSIPVSVSGIDDATAVSVSEQNACAVLAAGQIECWGYNGAGQLGNGVRVPREIGEDLNNLTPVTVSGITDATAVAAGGSQTCALLSGGSVDCWGSNNSGDLGIGDLEEGGKEVASTPQKVTGITDAIAIAAGSDYTCAVLSGGSVDCWGANAYGTLGYETSVEDIFVPLPVDGITDATGIVAGGNHTCALLSGGHVDCWGANGQGQLGDDTTESSVVPVSVSTVSGAVEISLTTDGHTCARFSDGGIDCWGGGASGDLGNDSEDGSMVPVAADDFG